MENKFSDRIGVTSPSTVLQVEGMTDALRNSLWNYLLRTIFAGGENYDNHARATRMICEYVFKKPLDSLPYNNIDQKDWLRKIFYLPTFQWYEVYNLIEFISRNIERMRDGYTPALFQERANQILEREMSGYRFVSGCLAPITNQEEVASIASSIEAARSSGLLGTQKHIETAISLLSKKPDPDYRNSIKESISAIESITKQITGEDSAGLEKALKALDTKVQFHGAFKSGLLSLYGYTCDDDGIRHAILEEPTVGFDEAKFMLVSCSALVNFLIAKASTHGFLSEGR
jgi:hypothetical protein